jgi:hypothetical protein
VRDAVTHLQAATALVEEYPHTETQE